MRNAENIHARLKEIISFVNKRFRKFGVNKKQEIIRLVFEISKKEDIAPSKIFSALPSCNFNEIKKYLVAWRFPLSSPEETQRLYLPKINLDKKLAFNPKENFFIPKKIIIESGAENSSLVKKIKERFASTELQGIRSLKSYLKKIKCLKIKDYNKRKETLFIVKENWDFFKKCPCTKNALSCGYHIFNLGFGCIFDCTYCYLQEYANIPGICLPVNLNNFFDAFKNYKKRNMRLGSGEFSDSLMLDDITEYSPQIIEFFKGHPDVTFEFKTKSANIENILKIKQQGNIVVGWTFSPQCVIKDNEFYTASLSERLRAAKKCAQHGYKISCHFDPILHFFGWEKEYERLLELVFDSLNPEDIAWISLGTLRFKPELKPIIEARFPQNWILDEEMVFGFDNKLRYPYKIRKEIYIFMLKTLRKHSKKLKVYLCMEEQKMWQEIKSYFQGVSLSMP